jgi:hypothetical protein
MDDVEAAVLAFTTFLRTDRNPRQQTHWNGSTRRSNAAPVSSDLPDPAAMIRPSAPS